MIFKRIQDFLRREERGEVNAMSAIGEAPELLRGAEGLILDQQKTIAQASEQRDREAQVYAKHSSRQHIETLFARKDAAEAKYDLARQLHRRHYNEEYVGDGKDDLRD